MKKRLLFILVVGISFAPPVFASEPFGDKPVQREPGEMKLSQHTDGRGFVCDLARQDKKLHQDKQEIRSQQVHEAGKAI